MSNKGFIYVGQYYHKAGLNLQELGITEKKVGKTINLSQRERGLNSTKMTIGYTIVAAFEVPSMEIAEKTIHYLLEHDRLDGEWFTDKDGSLVNRVRKYMILNGYSEVSLGDDDTEDVMANRTRRETQKSKTEFTDKVSINGVIVEGSGPVEMQFNILNELINNQKIDPLTIARDLYAEDKPKYVNGGQVLFTECNSSTYNGTDERYKDQRKWVTPEWGTICNGAGNLDKLYKLTVASVVPVESK